ncbi:hypothetical protein [Shewanella algae]|nr:hypothetical protein [Shewanella algae]
MVLGEDDNAGAGAGAGASASALIVSRQPDSRQLELGNWTVTLSWR